MAEKETNYRRFGARFKARRRAVELLFEAEARDIDPVDMAGERASLAREHEGIREVADYALAIVTGVAENIDRIDDTLTAQLTDWTLDRLPAVDRAVLRLGVWELFHADDVPPAVVVDEAVLLVTQLSTDDSPRFVNGVLGALVDVAPQVRAAARATAAAAGPETDAEAEETADGADGVADPEGTATESPGIAPGNAPDEA